MSTHLRREYVGPLLGKLPSMPEAPLYYPTCAIIGFEEHDHISITWEDPLPHGESLYVKGDIPTCPACAVQYDTMLAQGCPAEAVPGLTLKTPERIYRFEPTPMSRAALGPPKSHSRFGRDVVARVPWLPIRPEFP